MGLHTRAVFGGTFVLALACAGRGSAAVPSALRYDATPLGVAVGTALLNRKSLPVRNARAAAVEKVLLSFDNSNGARPVAGLVADLEGNLFGTTFFGGTIGNGTVFELSPGPKGQWTEQVLHNFPGGGDGYDPAAPLMIDASGNLYGTTAYGGFDAGDEGTVFELSRGFVGWTFQTIHAFAGPGGLQPYAGVTMDGTDHLYGTTLTGGAYRVGTVFALSRDSNGRWTERRLHSFPRRARDGNRPAAGLIFDAAGNLYGTTYDGGDPSSGGFGVVFELTPSTRREHVLYRFHLQGRPDGANPVAGLAFGTNGNLYGTTSGGGSYGFGTVYELARLPGGGWRERVLYSFANGPDGYSPAAGVVVDRAGNLYGTASLGGLTSNCCGVVFKLHRSAHDTWGYSVLYQFAGGSDGATPEGNLILDQAGNLYGTTFYGGAYGDGIVFEVTPRA